LKIAMGYDLHAKSASFYPNTPDVKHRPHSTTPVNKKKNNKVKIHPISLPSVKQTEKVKSITTAPGRWELSIYPSDTLT
jgi:hypothetical protein